MVDCGYIENTGRVATYKKSELVNSLLWYFDTARSAATPTAAQKKAREWLPDAMRFPCSQSRRHCRRGRGAGCGSMGGGSLIQCGAAALGSRAFVFFNQLRSL